MQSDTQTIDETIVDDIIIELEHNSQVTYVKGNGYSSPKYITADGREFEYELPATGSALDITAGRVPVIGNGKAISLATTGVQSNGEVYLTKNNEGSLQINPQDESGTPVGIGIDGDTGLEAVISDSINATYRSGIIKSGYKVKLSGGKKYKVTINKVKYYNDETSDLNIKYDHPSVEKDSIYKNRTHIMDFSFGNLVHQNNTNSIFYYHTSYSVDNTYVDGFNTEFYSEFPSRTHVNWLVLREPLSNFEYVEFMHMDGSHGAYINSTIVRVKDFLKGINNQGVHVAHPGRYFHNVHFYGFNHDVRPNKSNFIFQIATNHIVDVIGLNRVANNWRRVYDNMKNNKTRVNTDNTGNVFHTIKGVRTKVEDANQNVIVPYTPEYYDSTIFETI